MKKKFEVVTFFSAPIHRITFKEVLERIHMAVTKKQKVIVFATNIHNSLQMVVHHQISLFAKKADIVFADGVPLVWISRLMGHPLPERISGTDIVDQLLKTEKRIFLLGSTPAVLMNMIAMYNNKHRHPIVGVYSPPYKISWGTADKKHIMKAIRLAHANIVLVGVGYPKQEQWIVEHAKKIDASVFMSVGSAFDILSGKTPRAPKWMQRIGCEWMWRILLEPRRLFIRYLIDCFVLGRLLIQSILRPLKKKWNGMLVILSIVCVLLIFFLHQYTHTTVPSFRGDSARTGVLASRMHLFTPSWWRYKSDGLLTFAPVAADDRLYVPSWETGSLHVIDMQSGKLLWKFKAQADLPFSPVVNKKIAYIGSVDGHLYALDVVSGQVKWKFETQDRKSITSHPLVFGNSVIVGSRDGFVYHLDARTGKKIWNYRADGLVESSPIVYNGAVLFGDFTGAMHAVSFSTGKRIWMQKIAQKPILSSPALMGDVVYIGSEDGTMYALKTQNGTVIWKTKLSGSIDATSAVNEQSVFTVSLDGTVYRLDRTTGNIIWKKNIPVGSHAGFAIDTDTAYIGSSDATMYALSIGTGSERWRYTTTQPITAAPTLSSNRIIFTSGWYVYLLNKNSGKPFIDVASSKLLDYQKQIKKHDVFELRIAHDEQIYDNPWNEASVSARFVSPSGEAVHIDGFYYDTNEWRIRFSPSEVGRYKWTAIVAPAPSTKNEFSGYFDCVDSDNAGFIKISPIYKERFMNADGSAFYPVGIGDTLLDKNADGYPLNDFASSENNTNLSLLAYAQIYGAEGAGFNMFRWSVDNASFRLWDSNYDPRSNRSMLWETYPSRNGKWGDELATVLRDHGFHIWFTFWSFTPNVAMEKDLTYVYAQTSLETYIRYVVARYGAYVDIWELSNESTPTTAWITYVTEKIKAMDPYQHPITISWERPEITSIDITSPHWYQNEDISMSDLATKNKIQQYTMWNKPIVFGEQGNQYVNWDETSGVRMRVRLWTAFFHDAALIFWNTSSIKKYTSLKNANVYIGEDERRYVQSFQHFINDIPLDRQAFQPIITNWDIRAYGMKYNSGLLAYFFHYADTTKGTSTQVTLNLDFPGDAKWVNPSTGEIVAEQKMFSGWNRIITPVFATDIALKIEYHK